MCDCFDCHEIIDELNSIIDNRDKYTMEELKTRLEPFMYNKLKKNKEINISICPNTEEYCEIFKTDSMGDGVKAIVNIPPNTVIGCYLGCINKETTNWKYAFAYGLQNYVVDGYDKKSMMSIVNHSRNPNLSIDYEFHVINGKKQCHIVFITNKHIFEGDELYIDYGEDYWDYARKIGMVEINTQRPLKQRKMTDYYIYI